jgi:signal transduction histidine kinase
MRDVLVDSLLSLEKNIESKQVEIRGLEDMEDLFVEGDVDLIHQVVYNLVDNAVKFVDEGGVISARLSQTEDKAFLYLRNTGPGIAAEELPLVFERFYKTDKSRSRDKNGMGLGLYLVRTIVQLHQGEIRVSSVENEYTEFTVILPKPPVDLGQKGQG